MSDCVRWRGQLGAYAAGLLDEAVRADLEQHLAACASCRREADAARATWSALDAWQDASPPEGLGGAAMARYRSDRRIARVAWPSAAAAVVAVALSVWSWYRPSAETPTSPPGTIRQVTLTDADREIIENLDLLEELPMLAEFDLVPSAEMLQTLDRLGLLQETKEEGKS